jgi:NitT/TauT family transport system ATP-binding protein
MSSRPGRIKQIVDVRLGDRDARQDVRSSSEFAAYRHQVWSLLREEVTAVREGVSVG